MKRLVKFFTNHDFNDGDFRLYDKNGNEIYYETSDGYWYKVKFDDRDNETYFEDLHGTWKKRKYDENDNVIYCEYSNGDWWKRKYDKNDNIIYQEDSHETWNKRKYDENDNLIYSEYSDGRWWKREFDGDNNVIYHESSLDGVVFDQRHTPELVYEFGFTDGGVMKCSSKEILLSPCDISVGDRVCGSVVKYILTSKKK